MDLNLQQLLIMRKKLVGKYNTYCKRLKNNPKDKLAFNKANELLHYLSDLDQTILILKRGVENEITITVGTATTEKSSNQK